MSSSANDNPRGLSWEAVDLDLTTLAHGLGATQSPREAQFNAALDELARYAPGIPTIEEALAQEAEREAREWWCDEIARRLEMRA